VHNPVHWRKPPAAVGAAVSVIVVPSRTETRQVPSLHTNGVATRW
jgi:hypothetical protein